MSPKRVDIRTVSAGLRERAGRLAKAKEFLRVADDARELDGDASVTDAAVTLYVHAGIAAADAICAGSLGRYSRGENHQQAVQLLASVDKDASNALKMLLAMKTRAGYGHDPVSGQDLVRASRAARTLVDKAVL